MVSGNWFISTDNSVHLTGLADETGGFLNDATVTGVMKDRKGRVVPGLETITFTYVPSSNGNYDGVVPANDLLKPNNEYDLFVVAVAGGRKFTGQARLPAAYFPL
jgi:hypothetical protein